MVKTNNAPRDVRTLLPAVALHAALLLNTLFASAQPPADKPAAPSPPPPSTPPGDETNELPAPPAPPDSQPPSPPSAEPTAADQEPDLDNLEVIKVTVDRREKRIQDYAGSASAFTQEDLTRTGVNSVRTISNATPFVHVGVQEGNTEVYIRGVGSDNNTELGDPAAATHIDGIYIPRPRGVGAMFFDIERVEINRGPQGTLRGRNATAGSMNIITAKPKLAEWGAEASLQYGDYSQRLMRGMVNVPIGSNLALRFATFSENRDPFYTNGGPVSTLKPSESADTLAYRISAKWLPASRVTVVLGHDYMQEKGTGYGGTNFAPALRAGLRPEDIKDPRRVVYRGPQGSENSRHWGAHGTVNIDAGPVLFEYLGSYRDLNYRQITPGNAGIAFPGMDPPEIDNWSHSTWHAKSASVVQELRAYSPDTDRFRWTAGGFFFHEKQKTFLGSVSDQSNWYAAGEFNMPNVKGSSYAGYLDGTFDITQRLRVTGGIRYTAEQKSRTGIGNNYSFPDMTNFGNFRIGTEGFAWAGLNRTDYSNSGTASDVFLKGISRFGARDTMSQQLALAGSGQSALALQNGTYSDTFFDGRVGVEFDAAPGHLLYVNAATGHKSGGFNDNVTPTIAPTYKPESLYAFEVGSKNEFLNRKARVNVAIFDYEYRDQVFQNIVAISDPGDPNTVPFSSAVRSNAARSRVIGLELEARYQLPLGFVVSAQGLLLDARFGPDSRVRDSRVGWGTSDSPAVSIEGKWLPKSSRVTVNYSLAQNIKTSIGWFDWVVGAQTRSQYYLTVFNGDGFDSEGRANPLLSDAVPAYTRIDAGIGHTRPDGKLRFDAFVSNLTNVWYTTSLINTPGLNLRFINPPRQFGVRATMYW